VHAAALLLALASVVNALLALLRDRLLAGQFGASAELDIYYAAFRVPDIIYAFALLFVASTAFIPVFLEHRQQSSSSAKELLDAAFTSFFLAVGLLVFMAYLLLPFVIPYTVPGFDAESRTTVLKLASVLLLSPLLLGLSNLVAGVIQSFKRFFIYALSPVFYNIGIIIGILFFLPRFGLTGLVWGVILGAFMHFLIQVPSLITLGYFPFFNKVFKKGVGKIIRLSFPRALALSFHQLTFFAITAIASTLGAGAIAVFQLSYNLQSLPLAIVGLSYSVAAFPTLSELSLAKERSMFFRQFTSVVRHILFWTVPISFLFIVLRAHIVRVVLGSGAFDWIDTRLTAASLLLFSFGIVAQSLIHFFVRSYYALGRTREPVMYNFFGFALIVLFSVAFLYMANTFPLLKHFFMSLLRVEDLRGVGILVLPLAYVLGTTVNAFLLIYSLWHTDKGEEKWELRRAFREIFGAGMVMAVVTFIMLRVFASFLNINTFFGVLLHGLLSGTIGIVAGIWLLKHMRNREMEEVIGAFKSRFWRKKPLQPETEHL